MQITMAGILVGVGIIANTYIRIGYFTIITTPIYIAIGIMLPLWLGVGSSLIIDLLSLVLKGEIGTWYWTFGLEPPMIVLIAFMFKYLFSIFRSDRALTYLALLFATALIVGSVVIVSMHTDELTTHKREVWNKWTHKYSLESDDKFTERLIKRYGSLLGLLFVIIITTRELIMIVNNKNTDHRKKAFILVMLTSLTIEWFYHPWSVYQWEMNVLNVPPSSGLYTSHIIAGIWASTFRISLGIPIVASILFITKNISYNKKDRY